MLAVYSLSYNFRLNDDYDHLVAQYLDATFENIMFKNVYIISAIRVIYYFINCYEDASRI